MRGALPTWAALASSLCSEPSATPSVLTLVRERNGWCVHSSQLWLAVEHKGLPYKQEFGLEPQLQWADGRATCVVDALRALDSLHPDSPPLWPPPGVSSADVDRMVDAFATTMPRRARASTRAAFLFSAEEGFSYDALPYEAFVATLDATEAHLSEHDGPFFCGQAFSAADVVWAPQLERYAAQLPLLFGSDLRPRGGERWPRLSAFHDALDEIPAYACRIKGDSQSWRKVLSSL